MKQTPRVVYLGNMPQVVEALYGRTDLALVGWIIEAGDDLNRELSDCAHKAELPFFEVKNEQGLREALGSIGRIDLGLIANFGIILSEASLALARKGFVNAHFGLLPDYPGRNPIRKALQKGERVAGVTLHRVVRKVDAGPFIAKRSVLVGENRKAEEVFARLSRITPTLINEHLPSLLKD